MDSDGRSTWPPAVLAAERRFMVDLEGVLSGTFVAPPGALMARHWVSTMLGRAGVEVDIEELTVLSRGGLHIVQLPDRFTVPALDEPGMPAN